MVRTLHDHVRASKSAAGIVTAKCCSLFLSPAGPRRRTASLWQPSNESEGESSRSAALAVFFAGPRKHFWAWWHQHGGMIYPSGLAASARSLAYSVCNSSSLASICHVKYPRHLGSWAWQRTLKPLLQ